MRDEAAAQFGRAPVSAVDAHAVDEVGGGQGDLDGDAGPHEVVALGGGEHLLAGREEGAQREQEETRAGSARRAAGGRGTQGSRGRPGGHDSPSLQSPAVIPTAVI